MATDVLRFKSEFVTFMDHECGWPDSKVFALHLRKLNLGCRNGTYHAMRRGRAALRHYFVGFIHLLVGAQACITRERKLFAAFVESTGASVNSSTKPADLLKSVCDCPKTGIHKTGGAQDWLSLGLSGLQQLFHTRQSVARHIQACADDNILHECMRWIFMEAGNLGSPVRLPEAEAIAVDEARLKITLAEYESFSRACLDRHPWTLVLARGESKPTGVTLMLPLSAKDYASVRSGMLQSYRIDPRNFEIPSGHIFYEAVFERPLELGGEPLAGATRSLLWCTLAQFAVLSRISMLRDRKPIKILSFAAGPASMKRLEANGFRPVGTTMHGTDVPLYERTIIPLSVGYDLFFAAITNFLGMAIDGPPSA